MTSTFSDWFFGFDAELRALKEVADDLLRSIREEDFVDDVVDPSIVDSPIVSLKGMEVSTSLDLEAPSPTWDAIHLDNYQWENFELETDFDNVDVKAEVTKNLSELEDSDDNRPAVLNNRDVGEYDDDDDNEGDDMSVADVSIADEEQRLGSVVADLNRNLERASSLSHMEVFKEIVQSLREDGVLDDEDDEYCAGPASSPLLCSQIEELKTNFVLSRMRSYVVCSLLVAVVATTSLAAHMKLASELEEVQLQASPVHSLLSVMG